MEDERVAEGPVVAVEVEVMSVERSGPADVQRLQQEGEARVNDKNTHQLCKT